jgi:hypothetical protein
MAVATLPEYQNVRIKGALAALAQTGAAHAGPWARHGFDPAHYAGPTFHQSIDPGFDARMREAWCVSPLIGRECGRRRGATSSDRHVCRPGTPPK